MPGIRPKFGEDIDPWLRAMRAHYAEDEDVMRLCDLVEEYRATGDIEYGTTAETADQRDEDEWTSGG